MPPSAPSRAWLHAAQAVVLLLLLLLLLLLVVVVLVLVLVLMLVWDGLRSPDPGKKDSCIAAGAGEAAG